MPEQQVVDILECYWLHMHRGYSSDGEWAGLNNWLVTCM